MQHIAAGIVGLFVFRKLGREIDCFNFSSRLQLLVLFGLLFSSLQDIKISHHADAWTWTCIWDSEIKI